MVAHNESPASSVFAVVVVVVVAIVVVTVVVVGANLMMLMLMVAMLLRFPLTSGLSASLKSLTLLLLMVLRSALVYSGLKRVRLPPDILPTFANLVG